MKKNGIPTRRVLLVLLGAVGVPLLAVVCYIVVGRAWVSRRVERVAESASQDRTYVCEDPRVSVDRMICQNGEWMVAGYRGISHSGDWLDEMIGDQSFAVDSNGNRYRTGCHLFGEILLSSRPVASLQDFFERNEDQGWRTVGK
jgi:hypothetical protein